MHEEACGRVISPCKKLYFTCASSLVIIGLFLDDCQRPDTCELGLCARLICSYYCCQETDVSSRTGKKVCLRLWSSASARYGCVQVFVCVCRVCVCVGGWVSESMTWRFLHPVSAPDYGWCAQPCLAVLYYYYTTHTHRRGGGARESSCVWLWGDLGQLWWSGWEVVTYNLAFDRPLEVEKETCTRDQMCTDVRRNAASE